MIRTLAHLVGDDDVERFARTPLLQIAQGLDGDLDPVIGQAREDGVGLGLYFGNRALDDKGLNAVLAERSCYDIVHTNATHSTARWRKGTLPFSVNEVSYTLIDMSSAAAM